MASSDIVYGSIRKNDVRACMENANTGISNPSYPSEVHLMESSDTGRAGNHCHCIAGEHAKSCALCEAILEKSQSGWVFEWLLKLRDWENTLIYENECRQLTFDWSSEGSIDWANRIRDKLGSLQTEMVAFKFSPSFSLPLV
jgi:hypothetical protein